MVKTISVKKERLNKLAFTKRRTHKRICKICNITYMAADVKGNICYDCKKPTKCLCGCGNFVKKPGGGYYSNHGKKGKTYKEIYGTDNPKCGFKTGKDNIAKNPEIRKKLSEGVKKSYTPELRELRAKHLKERMLYGGFRGKNYSLNYSNSKGNKFRSSLEVRVSELFIENNIEFSYEVPISMYNGNIKLVDFVVNDVYIEISGFAYDTWKRDFIDKLRSLRKSVDNPILVLTYPDNIDDNYKDELSLFQINDQNVSYCSIYDDNRILSNIEFYQGIYNLSKSLKGKI